MLSYELLSRIDLPRSADTKDRLYKGASLDSVRASHKGDRCIEGPGADPVGLQLDSLN